MFTTVSQRYGTVGGVRSLTEKTYHGAINIYSVRYLLAHAQPEFEKKFAGHPGPLSKSKKKDTQKWLETKLSSTPESVDNLKTLWHFLKLSFDSDGKLFTK